METYTVEIMWNDDRLEKFKCQLIGFVSNHILYLELTNGDNRYIPFEQIRWYSKHIDISVLNN